MTPERWRRINELFGEALRLEPSERESWLRVSCAGDGELEHELRGLLDQDERADRDGFLKPHEALPQSLDPTASWPPRSMPRAAAEFARDKDVDDLGGFSPRAAIDEGTKPQLRAESQSQVRPRLRELPIIYILILGMLLFWTHAILGDDDLTIFSIDAVAIFALGSLIALLSSQLPISPAWLEAIELGMTGMLAGLVSFIQYRLMLAYSLRDDSMLAELTMKNVVLLDCILILTYGLYVPKRWRRAVMVVVPLALLPFLTLLFLNRQHPEAMAWLWRGAPAPYRAFAGRSSRPDNWVSTDFVGESALGGWERSI